MIGQARLDFDNTTPNRTTTRQNTTRTRDDSKKIRGKEDLTRAWEAVGGHADLQGGVSASKLKAILQNFELGGDLLMGDIRAATSEENGEDINFAEFCSFLDEQ